MNSIRDTTIACALTFGDKGGGIPGQAEILISYGIITVSTELLTSTAMK